MAQVEEAFVGRAAKNAPAHTYLIEPFDIGLHCTNDGVISLQSKFTGWLRALKASMRFVCWLTPATLHDKIGVLSTKTRKIQEVDPRHAELLMESRRYFEELQESADYQRSMCGMAIWTHDSPRSLANGIGEAFGTPASEALWPELFKGRYRVKDWYLEPIGRPGGRLYWTVLSSYEFLPAEWNFFKPTKNLLSVNFPMAICVDVPYTFDQLQAVGKLEGNILAHKSHLIGLKGGEDSRAEQRIADCRMAISELNAGDMLHKVQIIIAVAAHDPRTLRENVGTVMNLTRTHYSLRQEKGETLEKAIKYFSDKRTSDIKLPDTQWPLTSRQVALLFAPIGYRKLSTTEGVLRGEAVEGGYPVFFNSWKDRSATHEIWVGMSGFGKTFANNCYLLREWTENRVPFDLLEPMGHSRHIAEAVGASIFSLSAQTTTLNPQDIVFSNVTEQISHTISLYETVLGRPLSGGQRENMENGLLSEALETLYRGFTNLDDVRSEDVPTCQDVVDVLRGLGGENPLLTEIAQRLADEIGGICTGKGRWAKFLNGKTTLELARAGRDWIGPRAFTFYEMKDDPILIALAYTQILAAIRRDSLRDENPRIIAVDEVYRLARYPALIDFLVEAAKTFRTRRKKLICIDQNMMFFQQDKARYIFENSPIRVIFNQGPGIQAFYNDPAFSHYTKQHLDTIAQLEPFHYLFEVQGREKGIWFVYNNPSEGEFRRFGKS